MTSLEHLGSVWREAHWGLRDYLEPYCSMDLARALSSRACGLWVRKAADGETLTYGPYEGLYAAAQYLLCQEVQTQYGAIAEQLDNAVPVSTTLLPYQLSKIYTDIWRAGQLLHWDRKTINRASKGVSDVWPDSATTWMSYEPDGPGPLAQALGRRALAVLSEHECLCCIICDEASARWEADDTRTEQWFTAQRLARRS